MSALREHNAVVRKMDLQFIKMCGDTSTAMLTSMILLGGGVGGWRQGKFDFEMDVSLGSE